MKRKQWCIGVALLALAGLCVPAFAEGTVELSQEDLQLWEQAKSKLAYDDFVRLNPIQRGMAARLADGGMVREDLAVCFWGDVPEDLVALVNERFLGGGGGSKFEDIGFRWSTTATDGGGLTDGDATTLTYSFVPDGTIIPDTVDPIGDEPSNLFSTFDTIYGSTAAWQAEFAQAFADWGAVTGITYVFEPNDDGATMPGVTAGTPGAVGVRGDVRISGITIDGPGAGILAYNYFPDVGDMVIDTGNGADFYANLSGDSISLRNVIAHEHGHGLGMPHVCPIEQSKLMEPFLTTAFDGPQVDDILSAQKHYGDVNNGNNSSASATSLGSANNATVSENGVSLANGTESDFYSFTLSSNQTVTATVTPTGGSYLSGPQVGNCDTGATFNAAAQQNLNVEIRDTNGTTVLVTGNSAAAGTVESASTALTSGTYFARVLSASGTQVQGYNVTVTGAIGPTLGNESGGGLVELDDVTAVLSVDVSGATPPVTMQWFKDNSGLSNGGNLAGADTDTLTISPLSLTDTGVYFLRVTDAAKAVVDSDPIILTVATEVPVAGIVGLGILAGGLLVAGVKYRARKRG